MRQYSKIFFLLCCVIFPVSTKAGEQASPAMLPLFSSMKHRMSYLGERQAVLSKNIANANTPGYNTLDLKPFKDKAADTSQSRHLHMHATRPNHFSGMRTGDGKFTTIKDKNTMETTISGNNVSLDEEMRKVAENNLDYQATTGLYKKWAGVMRMAVTGNKQ